MQTTCKHCIFFKNQKCVLSKLENFVYVLEEGSDTPLVSGLCRFMRNVYWPEYADHPDATLEQLIDVVNEEVKLKYSVVVTYDALSSREDLENLIENLENQTIPPLSIIVSTNLSFDEAQQLYNDLNKNIEVRVNISSETNSEKLVQRVINKVHQKADYVLICYPESKINPQIIKALSERYSNTSEVYLTYLSEDFCLVDFDLLKLGLKMKDDEQNSIQFLVEKKLGKFLYGTTISEDPSCYGDNSEL